MNKNLIPHFVYITIIIVLAGALFFAIPFPNNTDVTKARYITGVWGNDNNSKSQLERDIRVEFFIDQESNTIVGTHCVSPSREKIERLYLSEQLRVNIPADEISGCGIGINSAKEISLKMTNYNADSREYLFNYFDGTNIYPIKIKVDSGISIDYDDNFVDNIPFPKETKLYQVTNMSLTTKVEAGPPYTSEFLNRSIDLNNDGIADLRIEAFPSEEYSGYYYFLRNVGPPTSFIEVQQKISENNLQKVVLSEKLEFKDDYIASFRKPDGNVEVDIYQITEDPYYFTLKKINYVRLDNEDEFDWSVAIVD